MIRQCLEWLENRAGFGTALRSLLDEPIPASSGWLQVFGSAVLFLFFTQAFTGILLAFNFAPVPGEAYNSIKYIVREAAGGRMIRGLHHWGASMMIVLVLVHMTQVFLYGAYKKPRELTWMVGVVLLLITFAFGLTGYLLPWDNRAYWGTVVSTQIAGRAPLLGGYVQRLLGASNGVGVLTFAHFYALHTLFLPTFSLLLIGFHLYLVVRHGVTPAPFDVKPKVRFFPQQLFKDTAAVFAAFVVLFVLAAVVQVPLEQLADPTDTSYTPRPDWYFLFLFQALKFFKGPSEAAGSVLLPTAAVALLFATPFLDRTPFQRITRRTLAIGIVVLAAIGWASLTVAAVMTTPKPPAGNAAGETAVGDWLRLAPEELAGAGFFHQEHCSTCHNLADGEPKVGPNLAELGIVKSTREMVAHFKNPGQLRPGSNMPPIELNTVQLDALSAFLRRLTPGNAGKFSAAPPETVSGAQVFVVNACGGCHKVNGVGGGMGPPLNGLSARRDKAWVAQHLADPASQTPGTVMPAFSLSPRDRDMLIGYLFSLPAR